MAAILISRGTMAGGEMLARCLSQSLGIKTVSREDLVALVDKHGAKADEVLSRLDRATNNYEHFSKLRRPYIILMRLALLEFMLQGDFIYHGYSGHLLLPELPCSLKVRVIAPMELRVKSAMDKLGISDEEEARAEVERRDEERIKWARFMYGQDIRNPALYDVCFHLGTLDISSICAMISASIDVPELRRTPEAKKRLLDMHLSSLIETVLVTDPETSALEIGAKARSGSVLLVGPYLEKERLDLVAGKVSSIPGVDQVEYEPGCPFGFEYGPVYYS